MAALGALLIASGGSPARAQGYGGGDDPGDGDPGYDAPVDPGYAAPGYGPAPGYGVVRPAYPLYGGPPIYQGPEPFYGEPGYRRPGFVPPYGGEGDVRRRAYGGDGYDAGPLRRHGEAPRYGEPPRYGEAPRHGEVPRYGEPPRYGEAPRYGGQGQGGQYQAPGGHKPLPLDMRRAYGNGQGQPGQPYHPAPEQGGEGQ